MAASLSSPPSGPRDSTVLSKRFTVAVVLLASVTAHRWMSVDFATGLVIGAAAAFGFRRVLLSLISESLQSFTLGEAFLVSQAIALFTVFGFYAIGNHIFLGLALGEEEKAMAFAKVLLLSCFLMAAIGVVSSFSRSLFGFCCCSTAVALGFTVPCLHLLLKKNLAIWFFEFVTRDVTRILLLSSWTVLMSGAIVLVFWRGIHSHAASSSVRKVFHALLLLVYLPGSAVDPELLRFCSMVLFGCFLVAEQIRVFRIPPVGDVLHRLLLVFLDEKDSGVLVLTHVYLLVGCSFPFWLSPTTSKSAVLSGILSIGIGDAVASMAGTRFGRLRLPGTKKTLEGTVSSMLSQIVSFVIIKRLGLFPFDVDAVPFAAIVCCSLLEAFTLQVDNLVIPPCFYVIWLLT